MRRAIGIASLILIFSIISVALSVASEKEEKGFYSVPQELTGLDWKRTPISVLNNPVKDEPIIWVGLVKNVYVSKKDGKTEIEWFCEHISFVKPGPSPISVLPIGVRKGDG